MNTISSTQNTKPNEPAPERQPENKPEQIRRINPRWFLLADPDKFFSDLIMEQNEQK